MSVQTPSRTAPAAEPSVPRRGRLRRWLLVVILGVLAATVIVVASPPAAPMTAEVFPPRVGDAIPGQRIVLLVSFTDDGSDTGAATVTAEALEFAADTDITVAPGEIRAGETAEVTVVLGDAVVEDLPEDGDGMLGQTRPRPADDTGSREPVDDSNLVPEGPAGVEVPIRITLTRGDATETTEVAINASRGGDTLLDAATPLRDRFVAWLATEHPDLGITADTEWTPTIVQPHILVVSHYLFFSEQWEMGLMWHIMIAPHDWSRIYLRPRGEMAPTHAFEIPSVSDPASEIRAIEVPAAVDR